MNRKLETIKADNYYVLDYSSGEEECIIFKAIKDKSYTGYGMRHHLHDTKLFWINGVFSAYSDILREPTQKEIQHLEQCIKAGQYVNYKNESEIINDYELI